ncbi:MAG: hypothetical protein Q9218_000695 [Villophora microphyllina]
MRAGLGDTAQIAGLQDKLEGEIEMLDGYEELPSDLQEKTKRALDNGHVDDEDWKGDLEQNRPGQKGFRSPAAKKKKKDGEDEDHEDEDHGESPSKPVPKKRRRAKKDDSEDEEPAPKKTKATAKKGRKAKVQDDESDISDEESDALTDKTPISKVKQAKGKAISSGKATKGKAKGSTSKEHADAAESVAVSTKKTKVTGKKGKKSDNQEDPAAAVEVSHRTKATARKTNVSDEGDEDSVGENDEQPTKATKKPQSKRNTANTKKLVAKKAAVANTGDAADTVEEPTAAPPKATRGRKKASKPNTLD